LRVEPFARGVQTLHGRRRALRRGRPTGRRRKMDVGGDEGWSGWISGFDSGLTEIPLDPRQGKQGRPGNVGRVAENGEGKTSDRPVLWIAGSSRSDSLPGTTACKRKSGHPAVALVGATFRRRRQTG